LIADEHDEENEIRVKVCDFGNSFLTSEIAENINDFDVQSLAYRAPEVAKA